MLKLSCFTYRIVDSILQEALQVAELFRLEIHGCEAELAKLREPLAPFNAQFFVLEYGFRNSNVSV